MRYRLFIASAAMAAALLAGLPAGAGAAKPRRATFGSTLNTAPTDYDPPATCDTSGLNADVGPCTRVAVRYLGTGAVRGHARAPISGYIRRIRIRAAAPGVVRVLLARVRTLDFEQVEGEARAVSRGRELHLVGRGLAAKKSIESFRVRIKVRKGDYLALESSSTTALTCDANGNFEQLIFQPPLAPFGPYQPSSGADDCTLLVQAAIRRR